MDWLMRILRSCAIGGVFCGMSISTKDKFFMWKLSNHCLPVMSNRLAHNIDVTSHCCLFVCNVVETKCNLFWSCHMAKALWFASPWSHMWDSFVNNDLLTFLNFQRNPQGRGLEFFLYVVIALEHIWKIHNSLVQDSKIFIAEECVWNLNARFEKFKSCISDSRPARRPKLLSCWRPPPANTMKINTDALVKPGVYIMAVVARTTSVKLPKFLYPTATLRSLKRLKPLWPLRLSSMLWKNDGLP